MNLKRFKTTLRNSTLLSLLALTTLLEASALPKIEHTIKKEGKTSSTLLHFIHPKSNEKIKLVLHERSGPCGDTHTRVGGYALKNNTLILCTTYLHKGHFKGVLFQRYIIKEDHFALSERKLYFEHKRLNLLQVTQKPKDDAFVASYEKSFEGEFVIGSEATKLRTYCEALYQKTLRRLWRQGSSHAAR